MRILISALAMLFVSSCQYLDGKSRTLDISDGSGVSLDISRRAILVAAEQTSTPGQPSHRVCAEPSPDAMTTLATQLSGSLSLPEGSAAELATAISESGAFVGMRTHSIQLLRDAMYRSCEAYLSGGIDENQYGLLLRRHQRYMVGLMSIEALSGTVRAPTVTISTESMASAAQSLSVLREELSSVETDLKDVEEELGKLKEQQAAATDEGDETAEDLDGGDKPSDTLMTQIDALTQKKKALESDKTAINKAIENASGLLVTGKTSVSVSDVGISQSQGVASIEKVSGVIERIAKELIGMDDANPLCLMHVLSVEEAKRQNDEVFKVCLARIQSDNTARVFKALSGFQASGNGYSRELLDLLKDNTLMDLFPSHQPNQPGG